MGKLPFLVMVVVLFLVVGCSSAATVQQQQTLENGTLSIVAPGCSVQDNGQLIIEINQTRGWMIAGPTGQPPSKINITINPSYVTQVSVYFRDAEPLEHFEDDTGAVEQIGLIINGETMGTWSFYDPYLFEGFGEGFGDHTSWKLYYDPEFKITFKYKPPYLKVPILLFSKSVWIHYKNLEDAGFEEIISLAIVGNELPDPVMANWETCRLESMTPWQIGAYGTFLTAFKTLLLWDEASRIIAQNQSLDYWRYGPLFMFCGVTNRGFIGGEGYTYLHTPFTCFYDGYDVWDEKGYQNLPDYDRRVKKFNIARGIILKELETIILNKIGINATSPVQQILQALEDGSATIHHDPCFIEYLSIEAGQANMHIDLAWDGQTIIQEYYPGIGCIYGAAGPGGACYHYTLTQHTQHIKIKDRVKFMVGLAFVIIGASEIIIGVFGEGETGGASTGLIIMGIKDVFAGAVLLEDSVEVEDY